MPLSIINSVCLFAFPWSQRRFRDGMRHLCAARQDIRSSSIEVTGLVFFEKSSPQCKLRWKRNMGGEPKSGMMTCVFSNSFIKFVSCIWEFPTETVVPCLSIWTDLGRTYLGNTRHSFVRLNENAYVWLVIVKFSLTINIFLIGLAHAPFLMRVCAVMWDVFYIISYCTQLAVGYVWLN